MILDEYHNLHNPVITHCGSTSFIMALFAGITAAIGGAPAIPAGFNGALGIVNVSENAEHVEPSSKLVVAPAGMPHWHCKLSKS